MPGTAPRAPQACAGNMDNSAPTAYVFEGYRLDLGRRRLSDPEGRTLPLSARAYDVLAYLVEHRARMVGKDELLKAVWSRVVVEENNLNQAIYNIRKVLGDYARRRDSSSRSRVVATSSSPRRPPMLARLRL